MVIIQLNVLRGIIAVYKTVDVKHAKSNT